jgi:hypothetical protein
MTDNSDVGRGATDEGWGDDLSRTGHSDETSEEEDDADDSEVQTSTNQMSNDPPTQSQQTSNTHIEGSADTSLESIRPVGGISWNRLLGDREVADHAESLQESIESPNLVSGDEPDIRPPMQRFLSSKPNSLDGTEQLNLRIEPETEQAYREIERTVKDEFDDTIKGAYLADAMIRVACLHSDEVFGMLGAYGFDFDFK